MDSKEQYVKSLEEIKRIKKSIGSQALTIKFDQLDGITQEKLRLAINDVLVKRESSVSDTITSVDVGSWG